MGFLKSLFGFGDNAPDPALAYPAPSANDAEYQREALDNLRNGTTPSGFTLTGVSYLCKKGENLLYAFNGVTHYCSAVHSEWAGRSAGTSVRIAKGFWIRTGANKGRSVQRTSMVEQGGGCLVLSNQALSFLSQEKSARIPLSHIMSFQAGNGDGTNDFEFTIETDYARNNTHLFSGINLVNVNFIKSVLELLANGATPAPPAVPPIPPPAAPVVPPPLPVAPPPAVEEIPNDAPYLKLTYTHGVKK
jgi:hypothetical protein